MHFSFQRRLLLLLPFLSSCNMNYDYLLDVPKLPDEGGAWYTGILDNAGPKSGDEILFCHSSPSMSRSDATRNDTLRVVFLFFLAGLVKCLWPAVLRAVQYPGYGKLVKELERLASSVCHGLPLFFGHSMRSYSRERWLREAPCRFCRLLDLEQRGSEACWNVAVVWRLHCSKRLVPARWRVLRAQHSSPDLILSKRGRSKMILHPIS